MIDTSGETWRYTKLPTTEARAAEEKKPRAPLLANVLCVEDGEAARTKIVLNAVNPVLEIQHTLSGTKAEVSAKIEIEVEAGCNAFLLERYFGGGRCLEHPELSVRVGKGAILRSAKIVEGREGTLVTKTDLVVQENAQVKGFSLLTGRDLARNEMNVTLVGKGAKAALFGLSKGEGKRQADTICTVHHEAEATQSDQYFKTVLNDSARAVFFGKIRVAPGAQKTDGYQASRALLLSDTAEMISKPELEIDADDVKCGHGSTVGDLDEEPLFYLRARGVPEAEARALLIEAFMRDVFDRIEDDVVCKEARAVLGFAEDGEE